MDTEKIHAILPIADGTIFVDNYGYIAERIGIAYVDNGLEKQIQYIDTEGFLHELADDDPCFAILGRRGDTVTLSQLSIAFAYASPSDAISLAKNYFNLKTDNLPDTLIFSFEPYVDREAEVKMNIRTKQFPRLRKIYFNLAAEDYRHHNSNGTSYTFEEALIPLIVEYAELIGKRPKLEIYIEKPNKGYFDETKRQLIYQQAVRIENQYLPRLRRYLNTLLDNALAKEDKYRVNFLNSRKEIAQLEAKYRTDFDRNPEKM